MTCISLLDPMLSLGRWDTFGSVPPASSTVPGSLWASMLRGRWVGGGTEGWMQKEGREAEWEEWRGFVQGCNEQSQMNSELVNQRLRVLHQ